jgi:hypothetical protein
MLRALDRLGVILLIVATIAAIALVPGGEWAAFSKPTTVAVYGFLITLPILALTRFRRALFFERVVFAVFLSAMPFVYVAGSLNAGSSGTLPVELAGVPIYVALAILGMKKPVLLAAGIVLHGVGWDVWHSFYAGSVPAWYAWVCMIVDLGMGAYAFARARAAY